jgi:cytochrome c oxidase subunit 3/cytochrome o ubiquinol oxidase subunit 3
VNETKSQRPPEPGEPVLSEKAASAESFPVPPAIEPEKTLTPAQWGILAFLLSEVALFGTLITTYLTFMGHDFSGPYPAQVLSTGLALVATAFLLSSSLTVHMAEKSLHHGNQSGFCFWWGLTITLGLIFLGATAYEWWEMITKHDLTISRNLFGSTYYTLVGFHGMHVTGGVIVMTIILGLALKRQVTQKNQTAVQMVSWYWHFVDVVWIVVFTVVYIVSGSIEGPTHGH